MNNEKLFDDGKPKRWRRLRNHLNIRLEGLDDEGYRDDMDFECFDIFMEYLRLIDLNSAISEMK